MKNLISHILFVCFIISLFFISDIIEKGHILNNMLPIPILGIIFWCLLIFGLYIIIIAPIIEFCKLTRYKKTDIQTQARSILNKMKEIDIDLYDKTNYELSKSLEKNSTEWEGRENKLEEYLNRYYSTAKQKSKEIIKKYSWQTALCIAFNRNSFIDGLLMFFSQIKMSMELINLYGYKSSPLFNFLCFFWIISNSSLVAIYNQAGADSVGEILCDMLTTGNVLEEGLQEKILGRTFSFVLEAITSATTIYTTGLLIDRHLRGEQQKIEAKDLFKMRRECKIQLIKDIPSQWGNIIKEKFPENKE